MRERIDRNRSNDSGRRNKPKKPSLLAQSRYNPRYDEKYDPRYDTNLIESLKNIELEGHPKLKLTAKYRLAQTEQELKSESNKSENSVTSDYSDTGIRPPISSRFELTEAEEGRLRKKPQRIKGLQKEGFGDGNSSKQALPTNQNKGILRTGGKDPYEKNQSPQIDSRVINQFKQLVRNKAISQLT